MFEDDVRLPLWIKIPSLLVNAGMLIILFVLGIGLVRQGLDMQSLSSFLSGNACIAYAFFNIFYIRWLWRTT
jgi:hypothetical protein